jgi:glucokinase
MPNPLLLGIEIGGTKLQLGLGRGDGELLALHRSAVDPERGGEGIRQQLSRSVDPLLREIKATRRDLSAVGIGFGGPVDAARSVVAVSNQVSGWRDFPLGDWARDAFGVSCVSVRNDAHSAALAESRWGAGIGFSPLLYVTIGSGIGGGLIVDGQIYGGSGAGAVEIGHVLVPNSPLPPGAEPREFDELEKIASGWSIGRAAELMVEHRRTTGQEIGLFASADSKGLTAEFVAQAAQAGDPWALSILSRAIRAMAHGLASAAVLFAPRRIILGGGVSLIGEDLWFAPIRRHLDSILFEPCRGTFDIVAAALGESVVVHGAIASAHDRWLSK